MTISELIERLEAIKAERGDIVCVIQGCCWSSDAFPEFVSDTRTYEDRDCRTIHRGPAVVLDYGL